MDGMTSWWSRDFHRYLVLILLLQHVMTTTPPVGAQQVTPTAGPGSNVTTTPALPGNVTTSSALLGNENTTFNNINVTQSQQVGNSTNATTTTSLLANTTNSISLPSNITNSTTTTPLLSNSTNATMRFTLLGNNTNITTIIPTTFGNNNTNLTTVNALLGNNTNLTTVNPLLGNATTLLPVGNVTTGTTGNDALAPSFDWSVIGIIIACSVLGFLQLLLVGICCFFYVRKRKSASEKIGSKESLRPRDENDTEGRRKSIMKSTKDGTTDNKTKSEHRVTIVENKEELLAKTVPTPATQRRVLKADNSGIGGLYFPQRYKIPTNNKPPPTRMYSVQAHIGGKPVTFVRPVDRPVSEPPPPGWMERFSQYLKEVGATATSSENK